MDNPSDGCTHKACAHTSSEARAFCAALVTGKTNKQKPRHSAAETAAADAAIAVAVALAVAAEMVAVGGSREMHCEFAQLQPFA